MFLNLLLIIGGKWNFIDISPLIIFPNYIILIHKCIVNVFLYCGCLELHLTSFLSSRNGADELGKEEIYLFAKEKYRLRQNKLTSTKGEGGGMNQEIGIDGCACQLHYM